MPQKPNLLRHDPKHLRHHALKVGDADELLFRRCAVVVVLREAGGKLPARR